MVSKSRLSRPEFEKWVKLRQLELCNDVVII